uniref:Uncharacterized protein n=1 Tax=uncultured marine thaumarchaeote KM3_98_B07 TaxID=1456351 RepID=A0A075I598_9ARCH|nr:hypothetical protein [uncultured marine thaumarchaeote KM3_98_B07]
MLNKYTIIGLIAGCIISGLGVISMIDFLANPVDVMDFDDDFGVGESTIFSFQAPENSFQTLTIIGDTFDVKILTSDEKNNIDNSYKNKADISWVNTIAGENVIKIQNTGNSELNAKGTLEKSRDPLFLTYHILVIIAGIVVIGFSAAFTVRKPRGF